MKRWLPLLLLVGCGDSPVEPPPPPPPVIVSARYELTVDDLKSYGALGEAAVACGYPRHQPIGHLLLTRDAYQLLLIGHTREPIDIGTGCPAMITTDIELLRAGPMVVTGTRAELFRQGGELVGHYTPVWGETVAVEALGFTLAGTRSWVAYE